MSHLLFVFSSRLAFQVGNPEASLQCKRKQGQGLLKMAGPLRLGIYTKTKMTGSPMSIFLEPPKVESFFLEIVSMDTISKLLHFWFGEIWATGCFSVSSPPPALGRHLGDAAGARAGGQLR